MVNKTTSDAAFMEALRGGDQGAPLAGGSAGRASSMKLNLPPTGGPRRSLDELIDRQPGASNEAESVPAAPEAQLPAAAPVATPPADPERGFFISLRLLDPHPWNARIHRSPARVRALASEIAATQQNRPITITKNPDKPGRYYVVDGETRQKALTLLKRDEAWVLEVEVDPSQPLKFYKESLNQTNSTERISLIDQGIQYGRLIAEGHATLESIAAELEVHYSTVSRIVAYSKFPPPVLDFMHEHAEKFTYSLAAALSPILERNLTTEEILAICQKIVDENYSRRAIEDLLKSGTSVEAKRPRRAAVVARPIKRGSLQLGGFRSYENGELEFKLKNTGSLASETVSDLSHILATASDILAEGNDALMEEMIARLNALKKATPA